MPGLRHEADFYGQPVLADRFEQRLELFEGALRERACRLEKNLQLELAVAELERRGSLGVLFAGAMFLVLRRRENNASRMRVNRMLAPRVCTRDNL